MYLFVDLILTDVLSVLSSLELSSLDSLFRTKCYNCVGKKRTQERSLDGDLHKAREKCVKVDDDETYPIEIGHLIGESVDVVGVLWLHEFAELVSDIVHVIAYNVELINIAQET